MKKNLMFSIFLMIFFVSVVSANAYTAYFAVDNTLNFDILDGFDIFVNPLPDDTYDIPTDLTFAIYHRGDPAITVDGKSLTGAVPDEFNIGNSHIVPWDIFRTFYGVSGSNELGVNLSAGLICSLSSQTEFTAKFSLNSDDARNGAYIEVAPYTIAVQNLEDGTLYTATNVPIPATALLFLSGIFGLVGIRRFRGRKLEG